MTDEIFVHKMNGKLEKWKRESRDFSYIRVGWDWMKYNVLMFSINIQKIELKQEKEREEKLQIQLANCANTVLAEPQCRTRECNAELENFYQEKPNGLIVRARARWHEYGRSTKYF